MPSSGMLHRVALLRTDISWERIASIISVTRTDELGTALAAAVVVVFLREVLQMLVTANVVLSLPIITLTMEAILSSETSVLPRAIWHNFPEDGILKIFMYIDMQ
jgi:hypothetical protein